MDTFTQHTNKYLNYCSMQKRLNIKTINDLIQFASYIENTELADITQDTLEQHIAYMRQIYQPKIVNSPKALYHYFEYKELIT